MREVPWDDPGAEALRVAQRAEVAELLGDPNSEPGPIPTAEDVTRFLVVYDENGMTPIACGGLRRIDDSHGEIKRMFVARERRGSGAATMVVRELERIARTELGWDRLVLETGVGLPGAIRFYEREGYTRIPNFGYYAKSEHSLCYQRMLA